MTSRAKGTELKRGQTNLVYNPCCPYREGALSWGAQ